MCTTADIIFIYKNRGNEEGRGTRGVGGRAGVRAPRLRIPAGPAEEGFSYVEDSDFRREASQGHKVTGEEAAFAVDLTEQVAGADAAPLGSRARAGTGAEGVPAILVHAHPIREGAVHEEPAVLYAEDPGVGDQAEDAAVHETTAAESVLVEPTAGNSAAEAEEPVPAVGAAEGMGEEIEIR